jgi:hypothetical protein
MNGIKVNNIRHEGGWLFHYAHFMCDLLIPEVINKIYTYDVCYREKNLYQSLGNFKSLWERIMNTKTVELSEDEFKELNIPLINISRFNDDCKNVYGKKEICEFREYIFKRFNIKPDSSYPEIILIERGVNKNLINKEQEEFSKDLNDNILLTGKERREIKDIELVKQYLNINNIPYKCIMLEHMDYIEQIKYFNNAKIIIASHGAAMSNLLFCNKNTRVIEVGGNWNFFNVIVDALSIKNIKCVNKLDAIISTIKKVYDEYKKQKKNLIKNKKKIIKNSNKKLKLLFV